MGEADDALREVVVGRIACVAVSSVRLRVEHREREA
jgi:hypothetical protein